jgi:hypothetical protein
MLDGEVIPTGAEGAATATPPTPPTTDAAASASASASPPPPPAKPRRPRAPLKKRLRTIGVRAYSGALALAIGTVCLMALIYLFRAVFTPAALPATFAQWQGRLDPAALRQDHIPGVTTEAGRAPMAHYHKVDRWFGPDPHNACTASGCHSPLPHPPKVRVAAFPNLHVTFLDCAVCHEATGAGTLDVGWSSSATGRRQQPPAVLRLIRVVKEMGASEAEARAAHGRIVGLLKEMDGLLEREAPLDDLLVQIESSVPGSPFWRKSVQELARELPLHARGEYGAKLTRDHAATDPAAIVKLTRDYFAAPDGSARRTEISRQIHEHVLPKPGACSTCHAEKGGMLNFQAAGYSPERARALQTLPLARMIEQIRAGESFQLPKVMEAGDEE